MLSLIILLVSRIVCRIHQAPNIQLVSQFRKTSARPTHFTGKINKTPSLMLSQIMLSPQGMKKSVFNFAVACCWPWIHYLRSVLFGLLLFFRAADACEVSFLFACIEVDINHPLCVNTNASHHQIFSLVAQNIQEMFQKCASYFKTPLSYSPFIYYKDAVESAQKKPVLWYINSANIHVAIQLGMGCLLQWQSRSEG